MWTIVQATSSDVETIAALVDEIEAFFGGDVGEADPSRIRDLIFGADAPARVLLARDGSKILGMAAYTFLWPAAGDSTSLYLKELYVREHARERGVARDLMRKLEEVARDAGCSRIEWTADRHNLVAVGFYRRLGYLPRPEKLFYRLDLT